MATVEQILDEATQIIADGWMQHDYCDFLDEDGEMWTEERLAQSSSFCSLGAIREAYRRYHDAILASRDDSPAVSALREALARAGVQPPRNLRRIQIDQWNDEDGRTQSEVVEMFQKAKAYAGEQGL